MLPIKDIGIKQKIASIILFSLNGRNTWSNPEQVRGLENVQVRAVSASGVVSAAIGSDGSLWVWGRSKRGQLGLGGDIIEAAVPSRVEALASYDVVKVQTFSVSPRNQLIGWEKTLTEGIMLGIIWMGACYGIDKGWKAIWLGLLREWTIGRNWPKY
jgi:hypothetical protein